MRAAGQAGGFNRQAPVSWRGYPVQPYELGCSRARKTLGVRLARHLVGWNGGLSAGGNLDGVQGPGGRAYLSCELLRYAVPPPSPLATANGETKVPGGIWFVHSYYHLTKTARGGLAWPGARW